MHEPVAMSGGDVPPGKRVRTDAAELIRLAWPAILARSGVMLMALVDTIMVGRYASIELAYLSIGLAPFGPMLVFGVGIVMGTQVMTAMTFGEGRLGDVGAVWRRGAPFGFAVGLAGTAVCLFGQQILLFTGQDPDLARKGGEVLVVLGLGLPFVLFFIASNFLLEGIKRPLVGMVLMAVANVVNLLLNWMLIGGNLGMPALGGVGSAWATTIIRISLAIVIAAYIWNLRDRETLGIRRRPDGGWASWARQRRIGLASGLAIGGESFGFAMLGIMAGRLGALALGAHAVIFNLLVFTAMIAIGVGSATAVRVGFAKGAGMNSGARLAGWTGVGLCTLIMAGCALVLIAMPELIAAAYTTDGALKAVVVPLIVLLGVIVLFDGNRLVLNSTLRGRGETWSMIACNTVAFLVIMVPLAWILAFPLGGGIEGLYRAVLFASISACVMMTLRIVWLGRRDPPDMPIRDKLEDDLLD